MAARTENSKTEEKLTRQRDAVLQVIRSREDHPTANEIFQAARLQLPTISYATVYNSLRFLKEAGLVHEIKFGDGASRYDRETERHDHAICNCCGKLVDFDLPEAAETDAGGGAKVEVQARVGSPDAPGCVSGLPQGAAGKNLRFEKSLTEKLEDS